MSAKKAPQGEMYAKWKRESNRAVGREGDEEDVRGDPNSGVVRGGRGRGRWRIASGSSLEDGEGAVAGSSKGRERDRNGRVIRSELRTKDQIRKAKTKVRTCVHVRGVVCGLKHKSPTDSIISSRGLTLHGLNDTLEPLDMDGVWKYALLA